eukprot:TRINITY_DN2691_c2_g1_i1.p3 TRINITY_DN2691_c2_g1~~TRINITY_DN2691_c2_g1_i1.p3  ORF type:complete len:62 (-),score=6.01 TRINITY_DN2691_c2_g1_i1:24-209(-)
MGARGLFFCVCNGCTWAETSHVHPFSPTSIVGKAQLGQICFSCDAHLAIGGGVPFLSLHTA